MLKLQEVGKNFGDTVIWRGLTHSFEETGLTLIIGPSGCGKTTLLDILGGQDTAYSGSVSVDGCDWKTLSNKNREARQLRDICMIPQTPQLFSSWSLLDNILLGSRNSQTDLSRAKQLLQHFGLSELAEVAAEDLSGGQKQRGVLIRGLLRQPRLMLVDEPTSALDPENAWLVMSMLQEISRRQKVIVVSHDPDFQQYADEIFRLEPTGLVPVISKPDLLGRVLAEHSLQTPFPKPVSAAVEQSGSASAAHEPTAQMAAAAEDSEADAGKSAAFSEMKKDAAASLNSSSRFLRQLELAVKLFFQEKTIFMLAAVFVTAISCLVPLNGQIQAASRAAIAKFTQENRQLQTIFVSGEKDQLTAVAKKLTADPAAEPVFLYPHEEVRLSFDGKTTTIIGKQPTDQLKEKLVYGYLPQGTDEIALSVAGAKDLVTQLPDLIGKKIRFEEGGLSRTLEVTGITGGTFADFILDGKTEADFAGKSLPTALNIQVPDLTKVAEVVKKLPPTGLSINSGLARIDAFLKTTGQLTLLFTGLQVLLTLACLVGLMAVLLQLLKRQRAAEAILRCNGFSRSEASGIRLLELILLTGSAGLLSLAVVLILSIPLQLITVTPLFLEQLILGIAVFGSLLPGVAAFFGLRKTAVKSA